MFRRQRALAAKAVPVVVIESTKVEPIGLAPVVTVELPVAVAAEPEKVLAVQSQSQFIHQRNKHRHR